MSQMDRAIGVGQGAGNEDLARVCGAGHGRNGAFAGDRERGGMIADGEGVRL